MSWAIIGAFALAVTLGAMAPGATTALVIRMGATGGLRSTLPVIAGMEIGLYLWAIASAVGVAALVAASVAAYLVLKIVGAVVLVFLGIQALRAARRGGEDAGFGEGAWSARPWRAVSTGLLTNLANPKIAIFAFSFYPQFVPHDSDVLGSTLLLALLHIAIDASYFALVAALAGRAREYFRQAKIRRRLEAITGTVLISLGAGLVFENT